MPEIIYKFDVFNYFTDRLLNIKLNVFFNEIPKASQMNPYNQKFDLISGCIVMQISIT